MTLVVATVMVMVMSNGDGFRYHHDCDDDGDDGGGHHTMVTVMRIVVMLMANMVAKLIAAIVL